MKESTKAVPLTFSAGIEKIIKEFKLPVVFPKRLDEELAHLPKEITDAEIAGRVDLRQETIVTIDGETARDFDDAVSVSDLPNGGSLLKVSIADVSHYVRPGSFVDEEAYRRANSSYFPDRCLPMLPERLSNDLCSLVPHKDRLAFTAEMEFDGAGRKTNSRFYRSVIRSVARLTYTTVRKILTDQNPETRAAHESILPDLARMEILAKKIQSVRRNRGSLDFDLPEPFIELDLEEGGIEKIVKAERNIAHRLIEEFMIAANEAVGEFIMAHDIPAIYRVHPEPDQEKARDFAVLLNNLGYSFHFGAKIHPKSFAPVIEAVRGKTEERLVNTLLLRTMKQAVYDTKNIGHFGLASTCYTHFTSPIRRYPDLIVHRLLAAVLQKEKHPIATVEQLQEIAVHCSERERNSMKAEWATRDLASVLFMKKKIGKTFEGIVSSVTKFGMFVELVPFFVEGLIGLKNMKDDFYVFHDKAHMLTGKRTKKKYQIGTPVVVRVRGVNPEKRWIDFEILQLNH